MNIIKNLYNWIDERVKLEDLVNFLGKKYVPVHRNSVWYYFGGVSLFFFIIQVVTGILLLFYYKGSADLAFESIQFIMSKVQFGWLIRSIHSWAANLFILAAFIHMFSVYFEKSYRKPREITWVTGMLMFFLALGFGFSGYLLPWNELAFFATKVGTDIAGAVPLIGETLKIFLRGGEEVTGATLSRLFGFHVALLPGIFTALLTIHLLLVQRQGMSEPLRVEALKQSEKKTMPFFPNFLLRDLLLWLLILNVLAILAVFFPSELGRKADLFASAPAGIKPEWYFLFMFQTLKYIPAHLLIFEGEVVGILLFMVAGVLWLLVPFWDTKSSKGQQNRLINYLGLFAVIFIIVLTILGWIA
ncbi:MAG: cytochrome bc complex cytochrome b subunit [Ignavibacteria bacterium RIFOXYB2_FULL_35_12]|nr:MAG: cytochrome bc complex cytochrome b subunit [Ignavibacteria bacterium GWA2_36_19]OGU62102.1 MAG: cytochrome bc complex cytochrome b subunit [Ignavibacteria bacterium GWF2_35_20]OGU79757.1 MAG: cytochrome bc complex cytochrome b subunit [Ignavibacteria bacterium RIFOXYA2_FULL_35_9]OGU84078.1 MAG: cytochrome bc complex cytochrome b subunit [Ignavibacteria bacterium RIFOXYA12_FULL_35_25]OGU89862.1 MAG: cytochrome bc complex cytochrome b subunit [Ignavibacteria bacterium RIFOXYC12_FULL_35_11